MFVHRLQNGNTVLTLDENDTFRWAAGWDNGLKWPCSKIRGHTLTAEFDPRGNLIDRTLDGDRHAEVPGDEFDAITTDHLPEGHPARRGVN